MFIATMFIVRHGKSLHTHVHTYIHTEECYSALNLKILLTTLRDSRHYAKRSKSEKDKYYIIYSLICGILKKNSEKEIKFLVTKGGRGGELKEDGQGATNSCKRNILVNMMYVTYNTVL